MCGIAVYAGTQVCQAAARVVHRVSELQAHRGPDDSGLLVWAPSEDLFYGEDDDGVRTDWSVDGAAGGAVRAAATVVLASRRLAILDRTPAGHQPMVGADGRSAVVLNGEIYNYLELRRELEDRGRTFVSRSDTEVLLAAFSEWGPACMDRLVGMFSFAILDVDAGTLFLARDPFGMKPLFYARVSGGWLFASEIGALLEGAELPRVADANEISAFLESGLIGGRHNTVFRDVHELPPAHCVTITLDADCAVHPRLYWTPDPTHELGVSFAEAAAMLRDAFLRSVELHLRSDVPVGVILSGGIDSSAVAMAMREVGGGALDLHAFSFIGEDDAVSEEHWIDLVVEAAGARVHKLHLRPDQWESDAQRSLRQGEPSGSLATWAQGELFRLAADTGVPVALSGQGADELLCGYARHASPRCSAHIHRGELGKAASVIAGVTSRHGMTGAGTRAFLRQCAVREMPQRLRDVLVARRSERPWQSRAYLERHGVRPKPTVMPRGRHAIGATIVEDLKTSLPPLLRYEDRNAMRFSVEGRLPFLTREIAELGMALPPEYLVGNDGTTKKILREALRGLVPDAVLDRRDKVGFSAPWGAWSASPEIARILSTASRVPALDDKWVAQLDLRLQGRAARMPGDTFLAWRIAGFLDWVEAFDVAFD